jgi:hypothetical protein
MGVEREELDDQRGVDVQLRGVAREEGVQLRSRDPVERPIGAALDDVPHDGLVRRREAPRDHVG